MAGNMFGGGGGLAGFPGVGASGSGSVEAVEDDDDDEEEEEEMPSLVSDAEYAATHGGVDTASVPPAVPAAAPAAAPASAANGQFEDNPVFQRFLANVKSRGFFEGTTEGDEGM